MDQNDKNNKNRRGRNSNLAGAAKLVAWALALTVVFYCTNSYMGTAGKQASSINIKYSDFVAMTEARVRLKNAVPPPMTADAGEFEQHRQRQNK